MRLSEMVARWKHQGIARPGAGRADIDNVERLHGVRLPSELASLFLLADGMREDEMDDHMIHFWPISELKPVYEEVPEEYRSVHEGFFLFADYSLWTHGYAIKIDSSANAGMIAIVGKEQPVAVATSFSIFIDNYLHHPDRLFCSAPVKSDVL